MPKSPARFPGRLLGPRSSRAGADEFDALYLEGRRGLLLQAFALTGDLGAATSAVRDAYVAARHHWDKVGRLEDPEEWIRPRAWAAAQRRHTVHPWHREKTLGRDQVQILEALHELPDTDRRILLLDVLARLPLADLAREVGVTRDRAARLLAMAKAGTAVSLGVAPEQLPDKLAELEESLKGVRLPRPAMIRRNGVQRRRTHALVAGVVLVGLTVGSGAFVAAGTDDAPAGPRQLVPRSTLLNVNNVAIIEPTSAWTQFGTSDNTVGNGIHSECQASAFADNKGMGTWVRRFSTPGKPVRIVTQTVEISASPGGARRAYDTTVGWFAGCPVARLLDAYSVDGVGNEAQALLLHVPGDPIRNYFVGVARTGSLTVSTLVETRAGRAPRARAVMRVLSMAVRRVCGSPVADLCVKDPVIAPVLPPPSGEGEGLLAVADLPPLPGIRRPWAGSKPFAPSDPVSFTPCDRTDFEQRGAQEPVSRTFLVPQEQLPPRFGIAETIGSFRTQRDARKFLNQVVRQLDACEDNQLSAKVTVERIEPEAFRGSQYALWRVESEVDAERTVVFWMGIARVRNYVAQVQFAPVDEHDVDEETFRALVTRARDRLFEVAAEPAPSSSPSPSPEPTTKP